MYILGRVNWIYEQAYKRELIISECIYVEKLAFNILIIIANILIDSSFPTTRRTVGRLRTGGDGLDGWTGANDAPAARRSRLPPRIRTLSAR